jgi:multimeric flavodoxin WrbA
MHMTKIVMKDGRIFSGPIYGYSYTEGWLHVIDETAPDKIYFRDMKSAITPGERLSINTIGDDDELQKARDGGWNGT